MFQSEKTTPNLADSLPNYYYTDKTILQRENEIIFRNTWQIMGREEELAKQGDYLTCEIAGEPIVIVRDQGELRAMHNVCAHRGMKLAEGKGNYKRLFCPYHGWTYDLDGRLRGVPYQNCLPNLEKENVRLMQAEIDTWGGFIFVKLEPGGKSLAEDLGGMVDRWEGYHADWRELREIKRYTYDEPVNWKIFMENATDYYHIPFIHQDTLELPPVIENVPCGHHFMLTPVTPEEEYRRFFDLVYPNMYFHVGPSKMQLFKVTPLAPDRSQVDIILYQTAEQATEYPINDPRKHRDIHQILQEDFAICRVLQQQASSKAFRIVYTAHELEEGVNHFNKTIRNALMK